MILRVGLWYDVGGLVLTSHGGQGSTFWWAGRGRSLALTHPRHSPSSPPKTDPSKPRTMPYPAWLLTKASPSGGTTSLPTLPRVTNMCTQVRSAAYRLDDMERPVL